MIKPAKGACVALIFLLMANSPAKAQPQAQPKDFNESIKAAVRYLNDHYARVGYDRHYSFTHDLPYFGGDVPKTSPATKPPPAPSMCVAAMKELILTALWLYTDEGKDSKKVTEIVSQGVDLKFGRKATSTSITPYLYMFEEVSCAGTADALTKFGMGQPVPFEKLKAGDFINLNRNNTHHTGHAVAFLGYLLPGAKLTDNWSTAVVGFRYFSDQGEGRPDGGLGYRNAFFDGHCEDASGGIPSDCKIIKSSNPRLLNSGRMWAPAAWTVPTSVATLRQSVSKDISDQTPGISKDLIDDEIDRELETNIPAKYESEPE